MLPRTTTCPLSSSAKERGRSRIELPLLGRTIEEDFGPSQLRTFVVPADPAEPVREVDLIERPLP